MGWPFPSDSDHVFYTLECSVEEASLIEVLKKLGDRDYKLSYLEGNINELVFRLNTNIGGTLSQVKEFILPLVQRALIEKVKLIEVAHRACSDGSSYNTKGRTILII